MGASAKAGLAAAGGVDLRDYNVLVGYKSKDYTVSAQTEKKASAVSASYFHAIAPDMTAAAVAKFPLAPKASASGFDVEIGLAYRLAADTTVTSKVNSAGKVAASYAAQVSPVTKLTFAAEGTSCRGCAAALSSAVTPLTGGARPPLTHRTSVHTFALHPCSRRRQPGL